MPLERRTVSWWQPEGATIAPFKPLQIVSVRCYRCGFETSTPSDTVIDAAVDHWRERYQGLVAQMNGLIEKCNNLHGYNPCERFFMEEMIKLRGELDRKYPG